MPGERERKARVLQSSGHQPVARGPAVMRSKWLLTAAPERKGGSKGVRKARAWSGERKSMLRVLCPEGFYLLQTINFHVG